jgi:hypothetical protein
MREWWKYFVPPLDAAQVNIYSLTICTCTNFFEKQRASTFLSLSLGKTIFETHKKRLIKMWRTTPIVYPLYASANILKNNYSVYFGEKSSLMCVVFWFSTLEIFFALFFSILSTTPMMKNYCVLSCNIDAPPFNLKSALVKSTKHTQQINPLCNLELLESPFLNLCFVCPY